MYGAPPRKQLALLGVLVVAGFVLPRVLPDYFLYVGNLLMTYAILAIGGITTDRIPQISATGAAGIAGIRLFQS